MKKLKTLRNSSNRPQPIVYEGMKFELKPLEERSFEVAVADKFLIDCAPTVKEVDEKDIGGTFQAKAVEEQIWIANMTGNPDASETIVDKVYDTRMRTWATQTGDNPKKPARPVVRKMKGNMQEYTSRSGHAEAFNLFPATIEIPPFKRRLLPKNIAVWMLTRDGNHDKHNRGTIIRSRAPSNFEPDDSWELDDMRAYLRLMDDSAEIGPSETHLSAEYGTEDIDYYIHAAKVLCLKRLHFRLADPTYRLFNRAEFNAFRENFEPSPPSDSSPKSPTSKRGRPKKAEVGVAA